MKLTLPTTLLSLLSTLASATVTFNAIPPNVEVGQFIPISWSSDRDYVRTTPHSPSILSLHKLIRQNRQPAR
jgi:hypothetical protein